MESNDLFDFMVSMAHDMEREYKRIQKRATEDPGTAGDQGEENWAALLRDWLPPTYQVVTKGRILSHKGIAGPQVDVLVLHPTYPRQLLDKKLYLAGGVAAAFECKLTLRSEHILQAIGNAAEIRNYLPQRGGTLYKELYSPLIYGLLAHSHCWKEKKSTPLDNIEERLDNESAKALQHPREMLDLVCVADLATWISEKWLAILDNRPWFLMTSYVQFSSAEKWQIKGFTAIGALISHLLHRLAWEDPTIRQLADYFYDTGVVGRGSGGGRMWDISVCSEQTREQIAIRDFTVRLDHWDEWSLFAS